MKTIIFAGGEISDYSFVDTSADFVICADRGIVHVKELGIFPDIVTGDFDSYTGEIPQCGEIYKAVPEKDDTDTMLALKLALERGATDIRLYGATGGRFDHTFANIQVLIYAHEHDCRMSIYDESNIITVQGAGTEFYPKYNNWYFSVFALTEKLHIKKMTGVKYPLENYTLTNNFPLGVSNEIIDTAIITIDNGLALIVRSIRQHKIPFAEYNKSISAREGLHSENCSDTQSEISFGISEGYFQDKKRTGLNKKRGCCKPLFCM